MSITFTDDRSRIFFEGELIAACPSWLPGRITDASITYVNETAYYYLFVTWGDAGVDSHIQVGRSREEKGPYLDPSGRSMSGGDDTECSAGFLFLSSFSFDDEDEIRGPADGRLFARAVPPEKPSQKSKTVGAGPAASDGIFDKQDYFFSFRCGKDREVCFPVLFSDDGWPLICPGKAPEGERVTRDNYTLKELQGFYECVSFRPAVPQVPYSSDFAALLPGDMKGIMSMQMTDWAYPVPDDADGRVELGGSIRGSYRLDERSLHLAFAHDTVTLCMCTATDASNGFPTIFLTGKSTSGIAYLFKKITLPQPNHYRK